MNNWLYIIPFMSAFAGWLIGKGAVYYIRHYYIPEQKVNIAKKLSKDITSLLPFNQLQNKMADPGILDVAMPLIEKHIDEFLNVQLPKEIPMLAMFIGNKTTDKIKEVFINQLRILFPKVMGDMAANLTNGLDINSVITNALDNSVSQKSLQAILYKQFRSVSNICMLTGFIVACINLLLFYCLS